MNFAYKEAGEQKHALVQVRVCPSCAKKLFYKYVASAHGRSGTRNAVGCCGRKLKRVAKEAAKQQKKARKRRKHGRASTSPGPAGRVDSSSSDGDGDGDSDGSRSTRAVGGAGAESTREPRNVWAEPAPTEPSRKDEFEEYFRDMFA